MNFDLTEFAYSDGVIPDTRLKTVVKYCELLKPKAVEISVKLYSFSLIILFAASTFSLVKYSITPQFILALNKRFITEDDKLKCSLISSKVVLGGESSGGLTVRGDIHGEDSVYAASLFAEMISVTGKSATEMIEELESKYGKFEMVEDNLRFAPELKDKINDIIFNQKKLPNFKKEVVRVNYEDGCKVYFDDDSFVICRFSGIEPLLRIFAESSTAETAQSYIDDFKKFLAI